MVRALLLLFNVAWFTAAAATEYAAGIGATIHKRCHMGYCYG